MGKYRIKYDLLIAILMAVFYAVSLMAARLQGGLNAVIVSFITFIAFVAFAYFMKTSVLGMLQQLRSLALVFLGLSALSLVWELLLFFDVVNPGKTGLLTWVLLVGAINAILSLAIIAGILYLEKVPLKDLNARMGDKLNIAMGVVGFLICILVSIVVSYFLFGGKAIGQERFVQAIVAVLAFSIIGGIFEELWFRGLLLNRITPILGESQGNVYQAAVFGFFEAVMFYTVTGIAFDLAFIILISAIAGYYWGRSTLKTKSLWSPMLLHAGLYVLITLYIIVALLS